MLTVKSTDESSEGKYRCSSTVNHDGNVIELQKTVELKVCLGICRFDFESLVVRSFVKNV